jgi:alpha-tubulin suppressor-like RCC1 family protein
MSGFVDGQVLISNLEQGSTSQGVPFEIFSDYTGKNSLTNSRQLRLTVSPSETLSSNSYVDMGIDNQHGNVFFITNPVFHPSTTGDRVFTIDDERNIKTLHTVSVENQLNINNGYINDLVVKNHFPVVPKSEFEKNGNVLKYETSFGINTISMANVVTGRNHAIAIGEDGKFYVTGSNQFGQLGIDNDNTDLNTFTNIPEFDNPQLYACVGDSSFVYKSNVLYACGYNYYAQLGLGVAAGSGTYTTFQSITDTISGNVAALYSSSVDTETSHILGTDGNIYRAGFLPNGSRLRNFTKYVETDNVSDMALGDLHQLILKNDGTVYGMGWSDEYQLGYLVPDAQSEPFQQLEYYTPVSIDVQLPLSVTEIRGGTYHVMAKTSDNYVWTTGSNQYGQLGLGDTDNRNTFTKLVDFPNVTHFACVGDSSFIVSDGNFYACGRNQDGQLGINSTSTSVRSFQSVSGTIANSITGLFSSPVAARHASIITIGGKVYAAGYGDSIGLTNSTSFTTFTEVPSAIGLNAVALSSGSYHTLVLTNLNEVYGCGESVNGELGFVATTISAYTQLSYSGSAISNAIQVSANDTNSHILLNTGEDITSGRSVPDASPGDSIFFISSALFTGIDEIATSPRFTLARKGTDLYFGGVSDGGASGVPLWQPIYYKSFSLITTPNVTNITDIAVTYYASYALKSDGSIIRTGRNTDGELGINNNYIQFSWENVTYNTTPIQNATKISAGFRSSSIVLDNGDLVSSGSNGSGQLGYGSNLNVEGFTTITQNVEDVYTGGSFQYIKKSTDSVFYVTGNNNYGQLGGGSSSTVFRTSSLSTANVNYLSTFVGSVFMLADNGILFGTGLNTSGELSLGTFRNTNGFKAFFSEYAYPTTNFNANGLFFPVIDFNGTTSNLKLTYKENALYTSVNQGYSVIFDSLGGYINANAFVPFTGAHECMIDTDFEDGLIVSNKSYTIRKRLTDVHLSNVSMDPCVIGVLSSNHKCNALGDGGIWVTDINGSFNAGDYITTSPLPGYGQKQNDDKMKNYTVGKILQNCNFEDGVIRYLSLTNNDELVIIPKEQYDEQSYRAQFVGCTYHCG